MSPSGTNGAAAAKASLPLVAATTAVLPAVALSSLALAEPAAAAPAAERQLPGTLVSAMERAGHQAAVVPAAEIAALVPSRLAPLRQTPREYTIAPGDTVWAVAQRFGLKVSDVLKLNGLRADSLIFPGKKLRLSAASAPAAPKAAPTAVAAKGPTLARGGTYKIRAGDTLSGISSRLRIPMSSLLSANGLKLTSVIYAGRTLRLPGGTAAAAASAAPRAATRTSVQTPAPARTSTYTIRPGDTLYGISARLKVPIADLLSANRLSLSSVIYAGRTLKVPGSSSTASSAVRPSSSTPVKQLVPDSFLGYKYPAAVVQSANENKRLLNASPVPSTAQMKQIVASTARSMGLDPSLALAVAYQESGFNQRAVSPANAIGTMQVIPSSGRWASELVGRKLNLLDPYDNVTAGVAILRALVRTSKDVDHAIAGYYQGQYSVSRNGMYEDTKAYVRAIRAHRATFR
ncbi:LysM peptidoglycan-binding domain-containing protein [Sinomonas halotolerans]|uniref:LysM peptidoglycan-binding domain-containing protein n=1 Tax=Sinomonas halotolerans TaxID=1644133 RepID=A0ABU9X503_9MICC